MKLSILIPTTADRDPFIEKLIKQFTEQLGERDSSFTHYTTYSIQKDRYAIGVEVIYCTDRYLLSIGQKRNILLKEAEGEYSDFIDSDDRISDNYFKKVFEGINKGVDCCSLKGVITEDGINPHIFEHSIKYKIYRTITDAQPGEVKYERYPNHLNCIKSSITKQFMFPEKNHGEDSEFAYQVFKSGLIKTEHYIPDIIYYYQYRSNK